MSNLDIVIAGYAETPIVFRSGRSAYDLAADVLDRVVDRYGISPTEIDGLAVTASISEGSNPFFAAFTADALGLQLDWLGTGGTGGSAMLSAVAAAASALRDGLCTIALVVGADAPSTKFSAHFGGYLDEFQVPTGAANPPAAFALLHNAYVQRYGPTDTALAKIVVTQRDHALANPRATEKLRKPLAIEDYLSSRVVSDPLRLLDSVMFCDGANGVLMMTRETANRRGLSQQARLAGYSERTNHNIHDQMPDLLDSGFTVAGKRALAQAGVTPGDLDMVQLYDDFTIAVLLQLEHLGFCEPGEGSAFIEQTDLSHSGSVPLNTGGGQLSAGQPGLAAGGLPLVEAVRQLFGEAEVNQIDSPRNALVTGIGGLSYGRSWLMSSVAVLDV